MFAPPRRVTSVAFRVVLMGLLLVLPGRMVLGQEFYREAPGQRLFSGSMVARPLQVRHWMERGFTEEQARRQHDFTIGWLLEFLDGRPFWHRESMDEFWFPLRPMETEDAVGIRLLQTGNFRYVCPNWRLYPFDCPQPTDPLCPDDPLFGDQWHHERIESRAGWQIRKEGHDDVVVTFFDSGIRLDDYAHHPDLSDLTEYRQLGYNAVFTSGGTGPPYGWENPNDPEAVDMRDFPGLLGHGIRVTGAGAATGDNNKGVSGIGWSLRHRMVKIRDTTNLPIMQSVFHGMEVMAAEGDRVFSFSYSTSSYIPPDTCDQAIQQTWQAWEDNTVELKEEYPDLLIFFAAGNDPRYEYCDPYSAVIMVGGTMLDANAVERVWFDNNGPSGGSATGDFISLMAGAKGIWTTVPEHWSYEGLYQPETGTSFAAPQAAALANLIWSLDPDFTAAEVEDFILDGCETFVAYSAGDHGRGRVNVFNSLALASGQLWTRTPNPGVADDDNDLKATGATNSATVEFFYGTDDGSTSVQGCSLSVDIADAASFGTATAGANGAAVKTVFIPSNWSTGTMLIQAVEYGNPCRKSNVVTYVFP